jgi:hypothetical protein
MASSSIPLWESVRTQYRDQLPSDQEKAFFDQAFGKDTDASQVVAAATSILIKASNGSKKSERFSRAMDTIKDFAPVFDVASQINGTIGCSIWAPLKLIIIVCKMVFSKRQEAS